METVAPKGTHQVEALFEVEADDEDDARHVILGLMEAAIKSIRVTEIRDLPLCDDDIEAAEFVLTPDELRRIWENSPSLPT